MDLELIKKILNPLIEEFQKEDYKLNKHSNHKKKRPGWDLNPGYRRDRLMS